MASEALADLMTTGQVARVLRVSQPWVQHLCRTGQLEAVQTPLGRLITLASAAALRERRRAKQAGR